MTLESESWAPVLEAAARLQSIVPDAVLVGGSAAAFHAGHRVSMDDYQIVRDLQTRFDAVLSALEDTEGWVTARITRPVLILGSLDGVETGIRNLIRRRPLEVEVVQTRLGPVRVPTLAETTRIKAWLVLTRNATRDYLDVVALCQRLGPEAASVLLSLDSYYEDQRGPGGARVATQLARQLSDPRPYDLSQVDLSHYRQLAPEWREWTSVVEACQRLALSVLDEQVRASE